MNPAVQIPAFVATFVTIMIVAKFKKLIRKFQESGTTSPKTAKTLQELRINPRFMFNRLVRRGIINEAGSGRYYLNESGLDNYNQSRKIRVIIVLAIIIILVLVGMFMSKSQP
jgi:hypothetical protein